MENKLFPTPIEYKVSRNDWFAFLTIRKEYDKLLQEWRQYFYIQMINQFSNYKYQNGWAFHDTSIGFEKYFNKLKFTWYLKDYESPFVGFQFIVENDFYFGMTPLSELKDLYNKEEFEPLQYFFHEDKFPNFILSPLSGINDRELLMWEIGNNPELFVKISNMVKAITENPELTGLFITLNKAKLELKES
jgi:hypothetical protein